MTFGLTDVSFRYGDKTVCEGVTWHLPERGVVCLWGPSGCGKTTLLRLLAGLLRPTAGEVRVPEKTAVVFQEDRLLPWCSALENVALPTGDCDAAAAMLDRMGLTALRDKLPSQLSGGEQRRVALARALVMPSELLLLDEPFTGMDEETRNATVPLISARAADVPVVLVTHIPEEAQMLGARKILLTGRPLTGELRTDKKIS